MAETTFERVLDDMKERHGRLGVTFDVLGELMSINTVNHSDYTYLQISQRMVASQMVLIRKNIDGMESKYREAIIRG